MGSPWDVAFGRLAVQHGLVAQEAVRVIYAQLPPGRTLKDELIARRLLAPDRAQALDAMLRAHASGRAPAQAPPPAADDSATMMRPAPAPASRADDSATLVRASSSSSGSLPAARPTSRAATRLPELGQTIAGRYELTGLLGKGGMGAVFKARDAQTGELYALKVLLPGSDPDGKVLARFRREAEAVAKVDAHAGIVRVRGLGEHEGLPYAVMDLVVGDDLNRLIKDGGPVDVARALRYTEAVARAVQHCHDKNVLHRDLKPANVLLRKADDAPLVMDFGLALDTTAERLTKTGEVMGTPAYMSPEQADGNKAETDARTDIYALGAILYALVKGRAPFEGGPMQILAQVFREMPEPVAVTRPDVPGDLDVIIRKAMAKDKKLRYATARDLADDVGRLARGEPITARPPTAREELEWRARRGDVRARFLLHRRRVIAATLVLLLIPVFFEAKRRLFAAEFSSILAQVPAALLADGPLEEGPATSAVVANLLSFAPPGDGEGARLGALADLDAHPLPTFELQAQVLRDDPSGARALRSLVRRLELPKGRVLASPLPVDATAEDRLMRAMALLRWARTDQEPEVAEVEEARALLSAVAAEGGKVGAAAESVLTTLSAVDRQVQEQLANDRQALVTSVEAALVDPRKKVADPYVRVEFPAKPPALQQYSRVALCNERPGTIPGVIAAITSVVAKDPPGAWRQDRRKYEVMVATLQECIRPLAARDPAAGLDPELARRMEGLLTTIGGRTFEQTAELPCLREFAKLFRLAIPFVGGTSGDDLRRLTTDAVFLSISAVLERGERPDLATVMILPPLHRLPTTRAGFEPYFRQAIAEREFDAYVGTHQSGDGYLVWAELLGSISGNDDRNDVPLMKTIREKLAASLGELLDAPTRARLELGPAVPLNSPLTPFFVPHARARVAVYTVRIELKRDPPRRPVIDAALELLSAMRRDRGDRDPVEHKKLVNMEADCLANLLGYTQAEPPWKAALEVQYEEVLGDEMELSWLIATSVAKGERREGYQEGSAGGADVRQDEDHMQKLVQDPINNLALHFARTGRLPAALELSTRSLARYRELGGLPFPDQLLRTHGLLCFETNDLEGAAAAAREIIEETRLRPGADPKTRRRIADLRNNGRGLLARVLARQGDIPGARALLDAAKQDGDRLNQGYWGDLPRELGDR